MENKNFTTQEILERLAVLRTEKKMSAYKLGMMLGHSKTYIYRIESGEIQLTLDRFLEILDVLNVTTTEFFCNNCPTRDKALIELIDGLSKDNKEIILELINRIQK